MNHREEIAEKVLKEWLKDKRIELGCGHKFYLHNFSNTMVIHPDGKTECSE